MRIPHASVRPSNRPINRPINRLNTCVVTKMLLAACVLLTPGLALASGDAGFTFTIHGFYLIDFAVFLGILVYFGRKPIAAALDSRYKSVVQDMDEAQQLRDAAQARFDEYKDRLSHLEEELAQVIADVRRGTQVECERILVEARSTADRIAAEEAARIAQEGKRVRDELAAHAVDVAVRVATEQIIAQLDASRQRMLVDRVIADLNAIPAVSQEVQA